MRKSTHDNCIEMLAVMPAGAAQDSKWTELQKLYSLVLMRLQDEDAKRAVEWAVMNESWRPAPARLFEIAAEQASRFPDSEQAYAEIIQSAQHGLFCRPHPSNPNIKLEGPPNFSHPLIAQIVKYCGGWPNICSGEANMAEGLKKQVRGAHESVSVQWVEEVKKQLILPAERRDQRYFPKYEPVPILEAAEEVLMIEPPRVKLPQIVDMPPEVRKMIAGILKPMPLPKPKKSPEEMSRREKAEAELKAWAERGQLSK